MNLLTFGYDFSASHGPVKRWALILDFWKSGVTFGIALQHLFDKEWTTWHACFYGISLTTSFKLGVKHMYYDGPHCSLSLGFLHILWSGNPMTGWCKKCEKEA